MMIFAAALLAASFAIAFLASTPVHAADGQWNGDALQYGQNQYTFVGTAAAGDSRGIPEGSKIYGYVEPDTSGASNPTKKAHLIYFAPGVDPGQATAATYTAYDLNGATYSNPTGKTSITMEPRAAASEGTTSCDSSFTFGVGWIICPITNFFASAMDWLFNVLAGFLAVRPVQSSQENALYRAWSVMRNFANVAFVIGFLIIIYSQITNIGLSNYDIKKMLPRLIIAAVLVNISYWICSIAIDISNIIGYSIQDIFISMRNNLVGGEGNNWDLVSWKSIGGFILSGGTIAAATGIGGFALLASAGTVGGALYMLLPILLGVLIAVLVALMVMAARQAIITILVIISPLAFVAYLLPNTEKYFEKWKSLGMTMLVMFPMFSIVFGGSQLAGIAIIQNADSINTVILGMAVQVAPVAITPLLLKLSGSLLARIGGIINNPSRGLIDRTRNFANERRDQRKAKAWATPLNRRRDAFARASRGIDNKRREREGWQKANEAMVDANWANSQVNSDIQQRALQAASVKDTGDNLAQRRFEASKLTNAAMQDLDLNARAAKLDLDVSKARVEANWEELKAGDGRNIVQPAGLAGSALATYIASRVDPISQNAINAGIEARREQSAEHVQKRVFSEALENNIALQQAAGGIDANGSQRALAYALKERHSARREAVDNANSIIEHSNVDDRGTLELAEGRAFGNVQITDDIQEAAIIKVASAGNVNNINHLMENLDISPSGNENHRIAFVEALKKNSAARPKYVGFARMNAITQGVADGGVEGLDNMIKSTVEALKFSPEVLVSQDQDALKRMAEAISRNKAQYDPVALSDLKKRIDTAFKDERLNVRLGERRPHLETIMSTLSDVPFPPDPAP
ncbi:MAG: oligosaccharide repeat unit polymerase [Candidatus Saccharibacteria bacterium]|nr:MAG: oligosaccharide repeat unit polymerase [Candidatus Saccharibacteria bacterium]